MLETTINHNFSNMSKAKTIKWSPPDNQLLLEAIADGVVNFTMAGKELMMALFQHQKYQVFQHKYTPKQVKNAMERIKNKATSPSDKIEELNEKLSIQNELQKTNGKPDVDGLTIPGSKATIDALRRLMTSNSAGVGFTHKVASASKSPSFIESLGLGAFANAKVPIGEKTGNVLDLMDEESEAGEVEFCEEESHTKNLVTENGSPYTFVPTHLQWFLEDENFNKYAVVAIVLSAGLGTSKNSVTPSIIDGGNVLRIDTYCPPALTTLRFFAHGCLASNTGFPI